MRLATKLLGADELARLRGRLAGEVVWTAGGMVFQLAGQVLVLKLVTTWLSKDEYGLLALAASAETFVVTIIVASLLQGMSRLVPNAMATREMSGLLASVASMMNPVFVALGGGVAIAAVYLLRTGQGSYAELSAGTLVLVYADYRANRTQYVALAARMRSWLALHRAGDALARAVAVIALVRLWPSASTVLFSWALASLVTNVFIESRVNRELGLSSEGTSTEGGSTARSRILAFATPLAVATVLTWANTSLDRWIVEHGVSVSEAGTYVAANQLSSLSFALLSQLLIQFAWPILYARVDRRQRDARVWWLRLTLLYVVVGVAGCVLLIFARNWLAHLILGPAQWSAVSLVPALALAALVFQLSQMFAFDMFIVSDTARLIVPNLVGGLGTVIAGILLVSRYGAAGVAWAMVIAAALRAVAMMTATNVAWKRWFRKEQLS